MSAADLATERTGPAGDVVPLPREQPRRPADKRQLAVLALILLAYLGLAVGWDRATPPFNNPDEPAHWNYIRYVAETGTLPVLRPGDDAQALVDRLKSQHYRADSPIDPIRYESHQPPLYYAIAAVLYKVTAGLPRGRQVEVVRLLSTLFGALTIVACWRIARTLLPAEPAVALAVAAFVAFVPMHVNMTAAVDNDALGDLLLALAVLGLLLWVQRGLTWRGAALLGAVIGLAALAKVTTLVAFPLAALAAALRYARAGADARRAHPAVALLILCAFAAALWGWWVLRNMLVYGPHDPLALDINRQVVAQPLTGPLNGAAARRFLNITFDSFWAQFGWMGIPVPSIYPALAALCALAALGLPAALVRALRQAPAPAILRQRGGEFLLVFAWPALVVASDVQYNLTFIQAQGRYLFPGLGGLGLAFALGLSRLAGPRLSTAALATVSALLALLCALLLKTVVIPAWR